MSVAEQLDEPTAAPVADNYEIRQLVPDTEVERMILSGTPAADFMQYIGDLEPIVADVCQRSMGKFSPMSLLKALTEDQNQWWVVTNNDELVTWVVTEILVYGTGVKAGNVVVVASANPNQSKRAEWFHLVDVLKDWARREGCEYMQTLCRPGWEKALKAHDFKKTHVQMETKL